jgi:hypothetical protein
VTPDSGLFVIWITFTVAALIGLCAILVWAVRSRQFSNQDDARYLPLKSGIPEDAQAGSLRGDGAVARAARSYSLKHEGTHDVPH